MIGREVVHAQAGVGFLNLVAVWGDGYAGTCPHVEAGQFARLTAMRSQCRACVAADPGSWSLTGPCDACGRQISDPGRWWVADPDRTAGVVVASRLCLDCSRRELTDYGTEENNMSETTAASCCGDCMRTFAQGVARGRQGHDFSGMHPECRLTLTASLKGYGRRTAGSGDLATRIRVQLAARALGGAA